MAKRRKVFRESGVTIRKYPQADIKILYGLAAGRCAFPACVQEVVLPETENDPQKQQIGKIAHIVGHSTSGPRGDPNYPCEKIDTYENWILLCPTCHDRVDIQASTYTVGDLRKLKTEHEGWVRASLANEMPNIGFAELEVVAKAIICSASIPSADFIVLTPIDKMTRNGLTNQVQMLLTMGLSKSREVRNFVQHIALMDFDFPERLKEGFVSEYKRLRNTGVTGDALFESLREFSAGGSKDFKRQAAGLSVLSYLFESCEVFEK